MNLYDYTAMRSLENTIKNMIDETKNNQKEGANCLTDILKGILVDLDTDEITNNEIRELGDEELSYVNGHFLLNLEENYLVFKTRNNFIPDSDEIKPYMEAFSKFVDGDELTDKEEDIYASLVEADVVLKEPYGKTDLDKMLSAKLSDSEVKKLLKEKGLTKTGINKLSFDEKVDLVDNELELNFFKPFFDAGYEHNTKTNYTLKKDAKLNIEDDVNYSVFLKNMTHAESIDIVKKLHELNKEEVAELPLIPLIERLSDLQKLKKKIESFLVFYEIDAFLEENSKLSHFSLSTSVKLTTRNEISNDLFLKKTFDKKKFTQEKERFSLENTSNKKSLVLFDIKPTIVEAISQIQTLANVNEKSKRKKNVQKSRGFKKLL